MERGTAGVDGWVRARPAVVDAVLAAVLAVVGGLPSADLVWGSRWPLAGRVGVVLAIVLVHAAVVARRVAPVPAFAVTCAGMLVFVAAPDLDDGLSAAPVVLVPSSTVFPVLLYAVAAYARRPWPVTALVVAVAGSAMTTARLWTVDLSSAGVGGVLSLFVPAALLAIVLASWGLGRLRAARTAYRQARIDALEERAVRAEERRAERAEQSAAAERARIAREMHDVVAHSLAVIVRQADGGRYVGVKEPQRAVEALATIAATGRQALTDMRAVLGVLRDGPASADPVHGAGPQPTVEDLPGLVGRVRAAGTPVTLTTTGTPGALGTAGSLAAYRVVQEALTNVVRHAGDGATATVHLDWTGAGLDLTVTDDGAGPAAGITTSTETGNGVIGMRERVAAAGGRLTAGPDGRGFAVRAHLPAGPV